MSAAGGIVRVRAPMREGHRVAAPTRGGAGEEAGEGQGALRVAGGSRTRGLALRRANLLETDLPLLASGRRRGGPPDPGGGRGTGSTPPALSPRSRELVEIIAPGGKPLGTQRRGATEEMSERRTARRGAVHLPRPGYPGRMCRLDDGSTVGLRPRSSDGSPGLDTNLLGFLAISKRHFTN